MTAATIFAIASSLAVVATIAYGVAREIALTRARSRLSWAQSTVARLLRASGHCDHVPEYRDGIRAFVQEKDGQVTIRVCGPHGQIDPGEPNEALNAAIKAIGDKVGIRREGRHYNFAVEGVHESATLRAMAAALSGDEIMAIGRSLGDARPHPAFAALAAGRDRDHGAPST